MFQKNLNLIKELKMIDINCFGTGYGLVLLSFTLGIVINIAISAVRVGGNI